jgi:protein-S-isoprenylcysteine O-methyltransferase Ste14
MLRVCPAISRIGSKAAADGEVELDVAPATSNGPTIARPSSARFILTICVPGSGACESGGNMKRLAIRSYSLVVYALFLATFVYFILFATAWGVPRTVDDGPRTAPIGAAAIDMGLVLFFGLAHTLMARASFKRLWTKIVPPAAERSTYVLVATAQIALVCWQWRPLVTLQLWSTSCALALSLRALQAIGWAIVLLSTLLIDHFELFGLRQGFDHEARVAFRTPFLYRWVRHPLYFGFLLALWSAPTMSAGHGLLSTLFTTFHLVH